jgi:hypothetical protein
MEGNQGTQPANSNPTETGGPEGGTAEQKPAASERVLFNGQEMEIDSFLKTRKHRVKVDGKEAEVDFDELVKGYTHGAAANARMREAAEARKELEAARQRERQILESMRNPDSIFEMAQKQGIDIDSYMHDRVLKKMQYEMMSPEERASYERDRKLEQYEARDKKEAEARQKAELERMRQHAVTELETNILSHLEKQGGNVSPAVVGRAVDAMIAAMQAGQEISIEEAFKRASGWFERERKSIFDAEIRAMLEKGEVPKELAEAVRKKDMAALRREPPKRTAPEAQAQKMSPENSVDDFFNSLEKRYKK